MSGRCHILVPQDDFLQHDDNSTYTTSAALLSALCQVRCYQQLKSMIIHQLWVAKLDLKEHSRCCGEGTRRCWQGREWTWTLSLPPPSTFSMHCCLPLLPALCWPRGTALVAYTAACIEPGGVLLKLTPLILGRVASRDEVLPLAAEAPDAEDVSPVVLTQACAILDGLACPVFSPLDYSTGAGELLQVSSCSFRACWM